MGRGARAALLALAPLLLATALLSLAVPVYTDEVTGKAMHGRLLAEGWRTLGRLAPSCGEMLFAPAWVALPFDLLDAALYHGRPLLWLRLGGALLGFGWLALTILAVRRLIEPRPGAAAAWLVGLSIGGLGLLPLYLVVNRPEQPLLIGGTVALLAPFLAERAGRRTRMALVALLVLLAAWMGASHARGAYFLPLLLAAVWLLADAPWLRLVAAAAVTACIVAGGIDWAARFACPEDAALIAQERWRSVALALQSVAWRAYLAELADRMVGDPLNFLYLSPLLFIEGYTGDWLPRQDSLGWRDWAASAVIVGALGIAADKVLTSPYCRAKDTGMLAFGAAQASDALHYSQGLAPEAAEKALAELKQLLGIVPPAGKNTVMVGHTSNLKTLAGVWPRSEGAAVVLQPKSDGSFAVVGSFAAADLIKAGS